MSATLRVLVVDDSPVVRMGLKALLSTENDLELVGEAGDGNEALDRAAEVDPDVVLLDVRMPTRDGVSVINELAEEATVIMMTFTDESHVIQEALSRGASGYLVHGTFDAQSLAAMIRQCAAGAGAFSGPALAALRGGASTGPAVAPGPASRETRDSPRSTSLSARQSEVMELVANGRSNQQIATELFLAEKTVKNHINAIFAELGVETRAEAIVLWLRR
ncbi:response regulator transcription factor [Janibacter sp. DB-40]|uniref:response regulator n=1 Tax=Janibacter sp. DB-40 TaxID=3028808 RepID=UPI0024059F68|nr:response regulator transcription factor [Janibacter sp. DB-40]